MSIEYEFEVPDYLLNIKHLMPLFPDRDNGPGGHLAIKFDNGLTLSIVYGAFAYATADTVEVAVFWTKVGGWMTKEIAELIDGGHLADDVDGYCDADRVHQYFETTKNWQSPRGRRRKATKKGGVG